MYSYTFLDQGFLVLFSFFSPSLSLEKIRNYWLYPKVSSRRMLWLFRLLENVSCTERRIQNEGMASPFVAAFGMLFGSIDWNQMRLPSHWPSGVGICCRCRFIELVVLVDIDTLRCSPAMFQIGFPLFLSHSPSNLSRFASLIFLCAVVKRTRSKEKHEEERLSSETRPLQGLGTHRRRQDDNLW